MASSRHVRATYQTQPCFFLTPSLRLPLRNKATRSEKDLQVRLDEAVANKAVNAKMESREKKLDVARRVPSETSSKISSSSSSETNVSPRTKPTARNVRVEGRRRSTSRPAADRNVAFAASDPARAAKTDKGEYYLRQYRKQTHSAEGWREVRITQYVYRPPN